MALSPIIGLLTLVGEHQLLERAQEETYQCKLLKGKGQNSVRVSNKGIGLVLEVKKNLMFEQRPEV